MNRRAIGTFSRIVCPNVCPSSSLDAYLLCRSRCQHAFIKTALSSPKFSLPSLKCSRHLSLSLPCLTSEINNVGDPAEINNVDDPAEINNVGDPAEINNVGDPAEINNVGDPEQQQTSPTDDTKKALKDSLMQRVLERGTELSLIIKMTEVSVESLFMTEDGDFESGYFISCIQKLAVNGEIDSQWHYLMKNFQNRWHEYAADFMLRRNTFLHIKDCFPPSALCHLSPYLIRLTQFTISLKKFDEQHIYQHMERKKAELVAYEVEKLVKDDHPKLRNAVLDIVKDAVEDLKIWKEHFEWSGLGFKVYRDAVVKLIQMKKMPDAYFILERYDSEILFTYMMRRMMSGIVEETVIHANDPKEAWSYTDRIIQMLHIKDYYRESEMTKEQQIFMGHLMDRFLKTLLSRFPAKSAVQTFFDVYHLYPSVFSLKIFFVLYKLIGAKELELIQKVMIIPQGYVMGDRVSLFTSLFCALVMRGRCEDAKKVLKDENLLLQCNRTVIYECAYFLTDHKMDVALVNLCELTKDMQFLDRNSMLNALGTVHARCGDSEKAYEVFLNLHNSGKKIQPRLINTLVYAYYQKPLPELLRPYAAKLRRNVTFLSSKKESGDNNKEYYKEDRDHDGPP